MYQSMNKFKNYKISNFKKIDYWNKNYSKGVLNYSSEFKT